MYGLDSASRRPVGNIIEPFWGHLETLAWPWWRLFGVSRGLPGAIPLKCNELARGTLWVPWGAVGLGALPRLVLFNHSGSVYECPAGGRIPSCLAVVVVLPLALPRQAGCSLHP